MRLGAGDYAHVEPPLYNGYWDYLESRSVSRHAMQLLRSGGLFCCVPCFDSDHLVFFLCVLRGQTDTGLTWSKPSFILGAGSAMPNLMRVGNSLVLSGGRNCNNINKTIDGCRRGADLMLWCVAFPVAQAV